MIPNLSNAATSNKNLYVKKKKKKEPPKYRGNRANIPNLSNAAKSNKDTFKPKGDTKSKTKTKTKSKLTGKERAQALARKRIKEGKTIAQVNAANKEKMRERARAKNKAFQERKKKGSTSRPTTTSNKKVVNNKKTYKKLNDKQFNKKFDIKKGDSKFKKFTKSGALSGLINRRLKILRNMKADDFRLNKKKKK